MPKRKNRRKCLRENKLIKKAAGHRPDVSTPTTGQTLWIKPHWVELAQVELQLPALPEVFMGKRIVQISDVHVSSTVSHEYLWGCIELINQLEPDMVFLTGDYVTYDVRGHYKKKAVELLGEIHSRQGVFACLGNHDYGVIRGFRPVRQKQLDYLIAGMQKHEISVLRNLSCAVEIDGQRLWLVGMGDLWGQDFHPVKAFDRVPADEAAIALVHNPACMEYLHGFTADVIISGHTHGGQVNIPFWGPANQYHAGWFNFGEKKLYVNRGLGRIGWSPTRRLPEITVFTLNKGNDTAKDSAA